MNKQEVAVKAPNELAFIKDDIVFGTEDVTAADIRISRVLLAQKMSPVTDKKGTDVTAGDLWDSVSETKICGKETPFSFIPLHIYKTLSIKHKVNGKMEFKEALPWEAKFANLPYEYVVSGIEHQNITNINILSIKESDLGNASAIPVTITFRSTSLNCGKDIIADCLQAKAKGASSAQLTVTVTSEMMTNDKGSFWVYKKKPSRLTKDYVQNKAIFKQWHDMFTSGRAVVDEESKLDAQSSNGLGEFAGQFQDY